MSIIVNSKKIVIGIAVLLVVSGFVFWFVSTKETRAANTEIKNMIKFAQRQALEIAIIEQSSKLAGYRQQLAAQAPKPAPPATNPIPIVADPVDKE